MHTSTPVVRIDKTGDMFQLQVNGSQREYDAVILATPQLSAIDSPLLPAPRPYQTVHVTFVPGALQPSYFGAAHADQLPDVILTTRGANHLSSVAKLRRANSNAADVFKIFSQSPIDAAELQRMFVAHNATSVRRVAWQAYPAYTPTFDDAVFTLADGLYHVSAAEQAASAIEMSVIGARNAVLLALQHLHPSRAADPTSTRDEL